MRYSIQGATIDMVSSVGGRDITHAASSGIIFATLTEAQANTLRGLGCKVVPVSQVTTGIHVGVELPAEPKYTIEELAIVAGYEELRKITSPPLYGTGFNLAIVDSGIRSTHEKVGGNIVYTKNFTTYPIGDSFNHGTGVSYVARAVAPGCNILNLKVIGDKGIGTDEAVVMAIEECIALKNAYSEFCPHVINLSLGGLDTGDPNDPMRVACRTALGLGFWIIAAAGNEGPSPGTINTPGCERYVASIGSMKYEPFGVSAFSSRGPTKEGLIKPDSLFFGEDLIIASSLSNTATIGRSGTSYGTPFSSGLAILYMEGVLRYGGVEYPGGIPTGFDPELRKLVTFQDMLDVYVPKISAKPQGSVSGKDNTYGYGLPLGTLLSKAFLGAPAVDITGILQILPMIITIPMIGMMMKSMGKGSR